MLCFLGLAPAWAQGRYHPGDAIPEPYLKVFGHERFFTQSPVDADLRELMKGVSYKTDGYVSWENLRYLRVLHRDADGNAIVGEMVCNTLISNDLIEIFKALFEAGYPIERMRLIDHYGGDDETSMRDNNTSCFNQRKTVGGMVSKHSYGLAVDVNPRYNPYFRQRSAWQTLVQPQGSETYLDREGVFPYKIVKGDLCYRLFRQHGFSWGGDWLRGKDYQHFEK